MKEGICELSKLSCIVISYFFDVSKVLDNGAAYLTAGEGEEVYFIIHAFGQNLGFWEPLAERILQKSEHARLIVWKARGGDAFRGLIHEFFRFERHQADIKAILDEEKPKVCHLVCWCTGAKLAIRCSAEASAGIASLMILSGSFLGYGGITTPETKYEKNMKILCQTLQHHPSGGSIMSKAMHNLHARTNADPEAGEQGEQLLAEVIKQWILETFETDQSTMNYAKLLSEFWSIDDADKLADVQCPVLIVAGQYDTLADPRAAREIADRIARSEYVEMEDANHYLLYEKPDAVYECMRSFRMSYHPLSGG